MRDNQSLSVGESEREVRRLSLKEKSHHDPAILVNDVRVKGKRREGLKKRCQFKSYREAVGDLEFDA